MSATVQQLVSALVDRIYPIGSIVCFSKDVDPNTSIGELRFCRADRAPAGHRCRLQTAWRIVMNRNIFGYPPPPDPEKVRTVTTDRVIYG